MYNNKKSIVHRPPLRGEVSPIFKWADPSSRAQYLLSAISLLLYTVCCILPAVCYAQETQAVTFAETISMAVNNTVRPETRIEPETFLPARTETAAIPLNETISLVKHAGYETFLSGNTVTIKETGTAGNTTVKETVPVVPAYVPPLRAGLSLMPTAYVRMTRNHDWKTGFNADFLFSYYIGELYEFTAPKNNLFFIQYNLFLFGLDAKWSFSRPALDSFTHVLLLLLGIEQAPPIPPLRPDLRKQVGSIFERKMDLHIRESEWLPTIAFGARGWLFKSMGTTIDLAQMFDQPWVPDYYVVGSGKIGDFGLHLGYVYGDFVRKFLGEIKSAGSKEGKLLKDWNIQNNPHSIFAGFDTDVTWGTKKFTAEVVFNSLDTFLVNTSTGLWGFDLAFLKTPKGFAAIGYWSFRSNIFTFF